LLWIKTFKTTTWLGIGFSLSLRSLKSLIFKKSFELNSCVVMWCRRKKSSFIFCLRNLGDVLRYGRYNWFVLTKWLILILLKTAFGTWLELSHKTTFWTWSGLLLKTTFRTWLVWFLWNILHFWTYWILISIHSSMTARLRLRHSPGSFLWWGWS